tara:strand:+ start:67 stop:297 length:231 start_codon:yes stop_codon:yes gene_type:complete
MDNQEEITRLTKCEWRLDEHDDELKALRSSSKELKVSLEDIRRTLFQIKWIAIGAGLVFIAENVGIAQAIKLSIGL